MSAGSARSLHRSGSRWIRESGVGRGHLSSDNCPYIPNTSIGPGWRRAGRCLRRLSDVRIPLQADGIATASEMPATLVQTGRGRFADAGVTSGGCALDNCPRSPIRGRRPRWRWPRRRLRSCPLDPRNDPTATVYAPDRTLPGVYNPGQADSTGTAQECLRQCPDCRTPASRRGRRRRGGRLRDRVPQPGLYTSTGRIDPRSRTGLCVGGRGLQSRRPTRLATAGAALRFAHTGLRYGSLCVTWHGGGHFVWPSLSELETDVAAGNVGDYDGDGNVDLASSRFLRSHPGLPRPWQWTFVQSTE